MIRHGFGTLLGAILLLSTGCTSDDPPLDAPASAPKLVVAEAVEQSIVDLKSAGAVRYNGSLTAPAGDNVTMQVTVTKAGEAIGELSVNGLPATVLVVDHTLYLKAGLDFWLKLSGVPDSTAPTVADHWVKAPGVLLGVDIERIFDTETLSGMFGKPVTAQAPDAAKRTKLAGQDVIEVPTDTGVLYLGVNPPYGLARFDLTKSGKTDPTKVRDLAFSVSDATSDMAALYRDLAGKAAELETAYDPFTGVKQGTYKFQNCTANSCSIAVELTNVGKQAARVAVKATWTGGGNVIGSCESRVGPLQPGQAGSATCTLSSPQWTQFYRRAQSVAGQHPYGAEWTAMALVTPPDPTGLRKLATSAETPVANVQGNQHVYVIRDDAGTQDKQIWKYGVATGSDWRKIPDEQLKFCTAGCVVDEVAATGDPASAHALARQLVDAYRGRVGQCPPAQWVGCSPK
ncbi:hypothetical protein LWC34_55770 [Kibdelosporangium philippinense]|uniref:LppP/LprE lipoprotein n=1 Tax=Kibdelosporangium philippinense TaxID=211113 RepID=A0ABS8ZXB3_9PSEU|nr:hypothetical protein [Kibdelosporangium philippinense]MCE7012013.1 hypothetical protein [Kibdelosporangium philippinense]